MGFISLQLMQLDYIYPNIGNLQITLHYLMTIVG